jgi:hypothetical protein
MGKEILSVLCGVFTLRALWLKEIPLFVRNDNKVYKNSLPAWGGKVRQIDAETSSA